MVMGRAEWSGRPIQRQHVACRESKLEITTNAGSSAPSLQFGPGERLPFSASAAMERLPSGSRPRIFHRGP